MIQATFRAAILASAAALIGCQGDVSIVQSSVCDGVQQPDEEWVDAPFDGDGDGYYDANNPDCSEHYEQLDCDDNDAAINPAEVEVPCNGLDDDCDEQTEDEQDLDSDGWSSCDDCDDLNSTVRPGIDEVPCNGVDDDCDPTTADYADADQDGYPTCEDCNDYDSAMHPGNTEIGCNGIDDDCNEETLDSADLDLDGYSTCDDDCNDNEPTANPGHAEVCDDNIDNDCDKEIDEECFADFSGTWDLDSSINYICAFGLVTIDFNEVFIVDENPDISVSSTGAGSQPGTMSGSFGSGTTFDTQRILTGGCEERYYFSGEFTSDTTFTGDFTAEFVGGMGCFDCTNQSWTGITGTR